MGLAVYLHDYQLIPYDRCCQLLKDVCGCEISPATLIRAKNICFENLKDFDDEIKKLLRQSPVIHFDETGSRVNGQRHWLHVTCTSQMTYYMIHAKRGTLAMDAMGILPGFIVLRFMISGNLISNIPAIIHFVILILREN